MGNALGVATRIILTQVNTIVGGFQYHGSMPRYRIQMINSDFETSDEGHYPSLETARMASIAAAAKIASESIAEGEATSAVQIGIFEGETLVSRDVVNLSVSKLTVLE